MMDVKPIEVTIAELYKGYVNDEEGESVVGYDGKLNIRPKFQRNFVYDLDKQKAVINTVRHGFPLNVMYWSKNQDGTFDLLDGQQRTLSICKFIHGDFDIVDDDGIVKIYDNLPEDKQKTILDYKLQIYVCDGSDSEKLDWFRTINIAGEKLEEQELKNAVYAGPWVTDAKRHFSKNQSPAWRIGKDYLSGDANRQKYLETAIAWKVNSKKSEDIEKYMSKHQKETNANELWLYYSGVISWVKLLFPKYRKQMKGIGWGFLWNTYHKNSYDAKDLETKVSTLMKDEEVQSKAEIYEYVFDHDERHLNLRAFPESIKQTVYEQQNGKCKHCKKEFEYKDMQGDHITPWSQGGKTVIENCQMLCKDCNRRKSDK